MLGRSASIAVVCLLLLGLSVSAVAQQTIPVTRRPSLSERLKSFRDDVLGKSDDDRPRTPPAIQSPAASASRKTMGPSRPIAVAPPAQDESTQDYLEPVAQPEPTRAVEVPQRMQIQSARRAQSGAPPVTVITPNNGGASESRSVMRRPAEVARRQTPDVPTEAIVEEAPEEVEVVEIETIEEFESGSDDYGQSNEPEQVVEEPISDGESAEYGSESLQGDADEEVAPIEVTPSTAPVPARAYPERNTLRPQEVVPADPEPVVASEPEPVAVEEIQPEPVTLEDTSNVLFTTQSPVLAVEASGPRTVMIGKPAEFLVKVSNSGSAANHVVVKIVIPTDADVASCRASAGAAQAPTRNDFNTGLDWTIDRLEAGGEETLTLKLVPRKSSPLDLAISYTFAPETSQTLVEVQEPKLAMSLSGPSEVLFGQTKVYKLTVSNPGNGDTHNVQVGLLPIGHSGESQATHRLGTLAAGESKTIDIELTARQAGSLMIKAQSFADGGLRAEAAEEVRVRRAELQVTVEAPSVKYAGTPTSYLVTVQNVGDALADNVQLSAILPADAKFLAASGGRLDPQQARVLWNVGSLPAGGQRQFELQCALNAPGENQFQVAVQGGGDLSATAASSTRVEAIADLKLEVRDPQGPVAVGEDAVYEIRVRNRGTKAAEGIDLAVFFSQGLEPSAAEGGEHEIGSGQVIFHPIGSIAAGDSAVFHVRARAMQAGNHVFRAEMICESLDTKLAAEEATHFYGDTRTAALPRRQPTPAKGVPTLAKPIEAADEPHPMDGNLAPPRNPYE